MFDYTEIDDDKFGTRCAFWLSHLDIPSGLDAYNPDCCFSVMINTAEVYMCH